MIYWDPDDNVYDDPREPSPWWARIVVYARGLFSPAPSPPVAPASPPEGPHCVPEAFRGLPVPEGRDLRMLDGTEGPEELVLFFGLREMP